MFARCIFPTKLTSAVADFDRRNIAAAKPEVVIPHAREDIYLIPTTACGVEVNVSNGLDKSTPNQSLTT
jgi:hypothetical protein